MEVKKQQQEGISHFNPLLTLLFTKKKEDGLFPILFFLIFSLPISIYRIGFHFFILFPILLLQYFHYQMR